MVHRLTALRVSNRLRLPHLHETRLVVCRRPVPVKPMGHPAVVGAAITHPAFATRPVSAVSGLDEHTLFAFKHLAHCGSLEHPVLVRGVALELAYRQLAAQGPTIEHQRVRIAN